MDMGSIGIIVVMVILFGGMFLMEIMEARDERRYKSKKRRRS